jgi:hypothetical protein
MSQGMAMSVKQSRVLRSKAGRRTTFLRAVAAVAYERAAVRSVPSLVLLSGRLVVARDGSSWSSGGFIPTRYQDRVRR